MKIFLISYMLIVYYGSSCAIVYDWKTIDRNPKKWIDNAHETIEKILNRELNVNIAKNIILFLGDGMGISTVTAGRILKGQKKGHSGEEEITHMESLDNVALSKTYNIDAQTADSAGTATAYLCGVKTGINIIGLNGYAIEDMCSSAYNTKVKSILKWAHESGKMTGIVTNTRITHATPSASYAHVPNRHWESFNGIQFTQKHKDEGCSDIASQLIDDNSYINVLFGGGRKKFLPNVTQDFMIKNGYGDRIDSRNLIDKWIDQMKSHNKSHKFIWNAKDFRETNMSHYEHVLALLAHDHMSFEMDRKHDEEPSLIELTEKAMDLLSQSENGYFLLVEGGRIDHGHHQSKAKKALEEFVVFDEAVGKALEKTSEKDTLVVVTADHSHTLTIGGYSQRGTSITGLALNVFYKKNFTDLNTTFTSLTYANGPGGLRQVRLANLTHEEVQDANYQQEAAVYFQSETHAGEDVAIYARGPLSHLFEGTVEQSFIAHAMAYSACIGPFENVKKCHTKRGLSMIKSEAYTNNLSLFYIIIACFLTF